MGLCKRLIARLDIKGSRLIKGVRFEGLRVLGDPCLAALRYAQSGADELLYVDAVASLYGRSSLCELLRHTSREVFIPITAGGAVRSVSDASALLAAGADKIAVNTAAVHRPELITELAETFGSQCVVASIQARRIGPSSWEAMTEAGRERSGRDVLLWIEQLQQLGAGELLLTSVDQDGTCGGPDLQLLQAVSAIVRVPLVLGGGFAEPSQVLTALDTPAVSAVSIGTAFHRDRLEPRELKMYISKARNQLPIRVSAGIGSAARPTVGIDHPLHGQLIGVVDYGMGNQQSLVNALEYLGASVLLSNNKTELSACSILALPGVGAFPRGMKQLQERALDSWLKNWVTGGGKLLAICLGMQMLFDTSDEFNQTPGLGLVSGRVIRLSCCASTGEKLVLPHLGWNRLIPAHDSKTNLLLDPIDQYFVHSYVASEVEPEAVVYQCQYGDVAFVAAVRQGSVIGFQFHPERSGQDGLALLASACKELIG